MEITAFFEGISAKKLRFSFRSGVREPLASHCLPAACLQRLPAEYLQRLPADFCRFQRAVVGAAGAVELTGLPYDERGFIATLAGRLERDHGEEIRGMSGQVVTLTLSFRRYEYEQGAGHLEGSALQLLPVRGSALQPVACGVDGKFTSAEASRQKNSTGSRIVGVAVIITDIVPF